MRGNKIYSGLIFHDLILPEVFFFSAASEAKKDILSNALFIMLQS